MLDRLRHGAVVGGDHQQHEVDAGRPRQHVVDELLVARNVDEAEHAARRRRHVGEAEVDRNAARFFLLEAIGIDAGQGAHQRGLAVIDMPCRSDDHDTRSGIARWRRFDGGSVSQRRGGAALCFGGRLDRERCPRRCDERLGERAPTGFGPQEPGERGDPILRNASAEKAGCAEHRLCVGVAAHGRPFPPYRGNAGVALNAERIVIDHADAGHRRGDPLFGRRERPAPRLNRIGRDALAFQQHPAQHVLRRAVALLSGGAIELGGARVILLDPLPFEAERGEITLPDRIARLRRKRQPARRQPRIASNAEALGEARPDIVLRPRDARLRERSPDRERACIIAVSRGVERLSHLSGGVWRIGRREVGLGAPMPEALKPTHRASLRLRIRQGSQQSPARPPNSANRRSARPPRYGR